MTERTAGDFPISPTTDWGRDLDILDPRYVADPFGVWRELRDGCPVAFSERRGRAWMPVNYDDISTVAHDTDHFSSRRIGVVDLPENEREGRPLLTAPPITSDPPEHTWARRILLPAFAPGRIETMTPITQNLARELLDSIAAGCQADAARDYAQHIPVRVIAHMLGVPAADEEMFTNWAVRILQEGFNDLQKSLDAIIETLEYFGARGRTGSTARRSATRRPHHAPGGDRDRWRAARPAPPTGNLFPLAARGHRYHLECDRFVVVAPRNPPGGSGTTPRRTGPHRLRRGGTPTSTVR